MQRKFSTGVIEAFLRNPHEYRFFQALRLLERWEQHIADERGLPQDQAVIRLRFLNSVALSFPPSEIESACAYDLEGNKIAPDKLRAAILSNDISTIEIVPSFLGLLGIHGALPVHYTEKLLTHDTLKRNPAAKAFFDLFSDRMVALFYQAWKKYRLPMQFESKPRKHYLSLLLSLSGLEHPVLRNRLNQSPGAVYDDALARYTTPSRQRPMSAMYLQRVLADYFRAPLRVEQFAGRWYNIPIQAQALIGRDDVVLGEAAYVGERVWQCDLRLRIWIGPLNGAQFDAFLPGRDRAIALEKLLLLWGGMTFEYEIRLIKAREDITGCAFDEANPTLLGWNTFLTTQAVAEDRSDTAYEILTLH
jgi:type VI secretion system protein ImpH